MKKIGAGIVLSVCVAAAQSFAQTVSDSEIEQACVALRKTPSDAKAVQALQSVAKGKAYPDGVRSRALGVCALTALTQLNTNQFARVAATLQGDYPGQGLITVTAEDCIRPCARCNGTGTQESSCPTCLASGICKACDGKGVRNASQCPTCKGIKLCARCNGAKTIPITCPDCNGSKGTLAPNERVTENCLSLLDELLDEVRASMAAAQSLLQLEGAWLINAPSAIKRLDAYLDANPHAAAQSEFGVLREKLIKRKWIHLGVFAIVGCVLLVVLVNILKATVFRPKPEPLRRPPGLAAIDQSKFTDPLAPDKPNGKR